MKQIIVNLGANNFRILYNLWPADSATKLESSEILHSESGDKLITKIRLPGRGGGYYHEEFILDSSSGEVVNLRRKGKY